MEDLTLKPNTNPNDMKMEEQFSLLQNQLQEDGDGTAPATIDSDALIQFFINDTNRVLEATDDKLYGVLSFIANRVEETHHQKIKSLYRGLIAFAVKTYRQSQTIIGLRQELASFINGNQVGIMVQRDQVYYANGKLTEIISRLESDDAMVAATERIEFEFEGNRVYVNNNTKDRIFRYWYLHRERHYSHQYSNHQIAKEIHAELNIAIDYTAKIISHVNRWFRNEISSLWLSGEYIQRTQMYFSYRSYTHLPLNYCHQPPNPQQIIALGQQLHVSTKEHPEE